MKLFAEKIVNCEKESDSIIIDFILEGQMKVEPKPYRLLGKIQNYEWGTKNEKAFIPRWLNQKAEKDLPYAEYWIGAQPKAPAEIVNGEDKISLAEVIEKSPREILGIRDAEKFNNTLPFLLKILSVNQALSIQAHPDKKLAKVLHKKDPANYPDENHKPEIAIAIDNLKAVVSLKDVSGIRESLEVYPQIKKIISGTVLEDLFSSTGKGVVKKLYSEIMNTDKTSLEICINKLKENLEIKENLSEPEKQFLRQYEIYGVDVGLVSLLLFNWVELKSGEALFTPAGIPHAYIEGNIIECMANSDNVVRAGLTPKFSDKKTLTDMLETDLSKTEVEVTENENIFSYKTPAEEFELGRLKITTGFTIDQNDRLNILIVLEGSVKIEYSSGTETFKSGDVILIPAILNKFIISEERPSKVYNVKVPG